MPHLITRRALLTLSCLVLLVSCGPVDDSDPSSSSENTASGNNASPTTPPGHTTQGNNVSSNASTNAAPTTPSTLKDRDGLFGQGVSKVTLEIDYQPGAQPYTKFNGLLQSGSPFKLTRANLAKLFEATSPALVIPDTVEQMQAVSGITQTEFTTDDILALAKIWRGGYSTSTERVFYVIWLDGYFKDESGKRESVLGVSLGSTGVIAMFKPVIASTSSADYVEQTTLIHEFGHAAGLVNNGVEMTKDHQDEEHGKHCIHDDCVMYWANEGAGNVASFVSRYVLNPEAIIFGEDCLADVRAAAQQP